MTALCRGGTEIRYAAWYWSLLAALAAMSAHAQELPEPTLDCTAAGYDVLITNKGAEILEVGTQISWNVRFVRHSGILVLKAELATDESVFISGGLGSDYLSSPQPCTAELGSDGSPK